MSEKVDIKVWQFWVMILLFWGPTTLGLGLLCVTHFYHHKVGSIWGLVVLATCLPTGFLVARSFYRLMIQRNAQEDANREAEVTEEAK